MKRTYSAIVIGLVVCAWSSSVLAQSAGASLSTSDGLSTSSSGASSAAQPDLEGEAHAADPFMRRHRPTPLALEVGLFGGVDFFPAEHNLQDLDAVLDGQGHQELEPGGEVGLRLAFYPLSFLGAELEGGGIFTSTKATGASATVWLFRGHGILQLPVGRLVPFLLAGASMLAASSDDNALGNDSDPAFHFGGGLKLALIRYLSLRLDLRDSLIQRNKLATGVKNGDIEHNLELLLGLSFTLGRTPWAPKPDDRDGDGLYDRDDRCPNEPGPKPEGCPPPPPPPDADGDGFPDSSDPCPQDSEDNYPPNPNDGCPNADVDADGIPIPTDICPEQLGVAPDGCPPKDTDGDGILDPADKCVAEPETKNNFDDTDGCPDELPKEVAKFTGVIKGILFASGKAVIRPASFPLLDDAVAVLQQYGTLKIRISGHTDDKGSHDFNVKLSGDRAASVKSYLLGKGIADDRIQTRGAGPDEPIADNKTSAGRQQNRRIEFELLPQ
jgi:outer membrane protein OmpA-like peptidoglycan-associated protein